MEPEETWYESVQCDFAGGRHHAACCTYTLRNQAGSEINFRLSTDEAGRQRRLIDSYSRLSFFAFDARPYYRPIDKTISDLNRACSPVHSYADVDLSSQSHRFSSNRIESHRRHGPRQAAYFFDPLVQVESFTNMEADSYCRRHMDCVSCAQD